MEALISSDLSELQGLARNLVDEKIATHAERVDRDCSWPKHSMDALAEAGLMGLHVPRMFGGHEQGMLALAMLMETIAQACPSSAMCYGMHCVGTAVIAAKATPHHEEHYLRPIAAGRHITTLTLSEGTTGAHFYMPRTRLRREGDGYQIDGVKHFVTNGGHADSYVVSTLASIPDAQAGEFSCLVVDKDAPGMTWLDPWHGLGMRGNSSRGLALEGVLAPAENLLGEEGDQSWYVFEVVAPYFLTAMAGTYLGIAQAALDMTLTHLRTRRHVHSGEALADQPVLQHRLAGMWIAVEKTRLLVFDAANRGDLGDSRALPAILAAKADAAETVVTVTNEAMTLCGGVAYRENSRLAQMLRDARAAHVMAPTTDILKQWVGRTLLGLPLL